MTSIPSAKRNRARTVAELRRLEAAIRERLRGRVSDLSIQLRDSGVVLRGTARSFYAKQLAQHAVMTGTDWPVIRNGIEVI